MPKQYIIKNKNLRVVQNLLDNIKKNPEKKFHIYKEMFTEFNDDDISKHPLKEIIEQTIIEMKDFDCEDIFNNM